MTGSGPKDDNAEYIRNNLMAEQQRRVNATIEDIDRCKDTSDVYKQALGYGNIHMVAKAVEAIYSIIPRDEESARELLAIRDALNDWYNRDVEKGYIAGHWDEIFKIRGERLDG